MELSIWTFLIVCPLTFLGGFVDAVAGGGGLISLPAYMIAGVPVHNAIATNKLSSGMGTTISTYRLAKLGYIPWKKAALCIIMAMIGSSSGAKLALMVDAELFKRIMLVIIPLTALYVMRNAHFRLGEANGVAKSINLTTNLTSLAVYLMNGKVILLLGFFGGLFGIIGNYIGVTFFEKKGAKAVRPLMIIVLVIFFIRILTEIL